MLTKTPEAVQEHDRCHAMITVETPDVSGQLRLTKITHEAAPAYGRGHAIPPVESLDLSLQYPKNFKTEC